MTITARLAGIGGLALTAATALLTAAAAAPAASASTTAAPALAAHQGAGAVFVQTDNLSGNSVVAYGRSAAGTLRQAGTYPTGGVGGALNGSVVDHLASQGSLSYDRRAGLLYAVNAGSNTITVFAVHGDRLSRRQVISSGGDFPVSVAARGGLVYVLNARGGGSVQGYRLVLGHLVLVPAWHRDLGFDPSMTPEFTSTPAQIGFSPDSSQLLVTTKGDGSSIEVFGIRGHGGLSASPVVNAEPGAAPFGFTFDARGNLLVTEAGPNAVASFTLRSDGTVTPVDHQATGQQATCWIAGTGALFYASNAGSATLSGYQDSGNGALTGLGNTSTDAGTVDAAVAGGRFLYVQAGAKGIVDEYRIGAGGSLTPIGSVTVPGAAGGEGIAAS